MKRAIFFIIVTIIVMQAGATGQFSERLNYKGKNVQLHSLLLELNDELYRNITKRLPEDWYNTALWRKYIGHWKIENDSLFLDSIAVFQGDNLKALNINDLVLKYRLPDGRIFCSWVSDTLRIAEGECVRYEHMGWNQNYEKEWDILLKNGIVTEITPYINRIIVRGVSSDIEIMKVLSGFPIEKYPTVDRIIFTVSNINIDSDYKINSYDIKLLRVAPKNSITEEDMPAIIADIQNILNDQHIVPVSIIRGQLYVTPYVYIISRKNIIGVR